MTWESADNWEDAEGWEAPKKEKTFLENSKEGGLGSIAALSDIATGVVKFPVARAGAIAAKISHPSYNWDELRDASDAAVEGYMPSLGKAWGVDKSLGYEVPMKPFEWLGEGVNYLGDKYGELTGGGKNASGSMKMALDIGMLAGIPGAKQAGKLAKKGIEVIDPALHDKNFKKQPINMDAVWEDAPKKPEVVPTDPIQMIVDQQLSGWHEPLRPPAKNGIDVVKEQLEAGKHQEVQNVIDQRQKALELDVQRQAALDGQAAERARQENAPTGYPEYVENMRNNAETRSPGDNTPLELTKDETPRSLQDTPYQHEGGLDMPVADELSKPIQKEVDINQAWEQRSPELRKEMEDAHAREQEAASRADELSRLQQDLIEGKPIAKGRFQVPKSQRGAIDVKNISESLDKLKQGLIKTTDYLESFKGTFAPQELDSARKAMMNPASKDRIVFMSPEMFHNYAEKRTQDFGSSAVRRDSVREGLQSEQGLTDIPYLKGTIVDGKFKVESHNGRHRMDVFQEQGVQSVPVRLRVWDEGFKGWGHEPPISGIVGQNLGKYIPKGQRGAIDLGVPEPKDNKIATLNKDSESVKLATMQLSKEKKQEIVAKMIDNPLLDAYTTKIDSPEKVIALAPETKDISPAVEAKARTVSPGMNSVAISTNNPLLRYTRDAISKVIRQTDQLTREYVTGPNGFGAKLKKLNQAEKNNVVAVLQDADKYQRAIDSDKLREAGFNERQIDLIEHIQIMDAKKLEIWNDVRMDLGMEPVKNRAGHFAGNFSGDYRTLVLDKDGHPVGFIGTTTRIGNELLKREVTKENSSLTFAPTKRVKLGGNGAKAAMYEGMQDIIATLAKDDPRFAEIQAVVDAAIKDRGDSLYGAALHAGDKKGIWGNDGAKFWEDQKTNTNEALKSFVDYWEGGIASHLNLPTEVQLKGLMDNPALDHMPRAKRYANDYINNFTGRNLGTTGDALNTLIDTPARFLGIGPSVTRGAITQFNKRASQFTMGFVNPLFLTTQYLQVLQTGMPELIKIQNSLGLHPAAAEASMGKAVKDGMKLAIEAHTGKKADLDPYTREAYQYAKDNGLLAFSEYANARDIFQHPASKAFDIAADSARTKAEQSTRPLVFFSAVDMLKDSGMTPKEAFDTAYNITQHSMMNYHTSEKPLMYGRMGVAGQAAGSLQTFKHAYLGQLGTFISDARPKTLGGKGNPGPLLAAALMIYAFSGIKGVPFYEEADQLFKHITDSYYSDRKSIADAVMPNVPEWAKSGALSTTTGINMQSRLSSADVLPNSALEAVSPFSSWGSKIGKAGVDVYDNNDKLAWSNLAVATAPSGTIKGMVETALKTNEKGQSINRTGEVDYPRTQEDRDIKQWSGGTSLNESLAKSKQYDQMTNSKHRKEAQTAITKEAQRMLAQGTLTQESMNKIVEQYIKEKGDPQQLVVALVNYAQTKNLTTKQRLEGIPNGGLSSANRYLNYND